MSFFYRPKKEKSLVYWNSVKKTMTNNWKCAQHSVFFCCFCFFGKPQCDFAPSPLCPAQKLSLYSVRQFFGFQSDCLLVNWGDNVVVLHGFYLCEKYSRTRRRCPRRSLSEVRDRTLVWYAGSSWRTESSHQHQAGPLDEAWRTNKSYYNRQKHAIIKQ